MFNLCCKRYKSFNSRIRFWMPVSSGAGHFSSGGKTIACIVYRFKPQIFSVRPDFVKIYGRARAAPRLKSPGDFGRKTFEIFGKLRNIRRNEILHSAFCRLLRVFRPICCVFCGGLPEIRAFRLPEYNGALLDEGFSGGLFGVRAPNGAYACHILPWNGEQPARRGNVFLF